MYENIVQKHMNKFMIYEFSFKEFTNFTNEKFVKPFGEQLIAFDKK